MTPDNGALPEGTVRFVLGGELREVRAPDPNQTLLEYLRGDAGRTGTKEGCAEGDCGACTVVVASPGGEGRLGYRAVNACIRLLPTLDGCEVLTVEDLAASPERLHPVQEALVRHHGSQCGFCTPGFVMSLFALYRTTPNPDRRTVERVLAGNLCRCTGYRPIIDAALDMGPIGEQTPESARGRFDRLPGDGATSADAAESAATDRLDALAAQRATAPLDYHARSASGATHHYCAPDSLDGVFAFKAEHPDARVLAGGTDLGLEITKARRDIDTLLDIRAVTELAAIVTRDGHLSIGAAVTVEDAMPALLAWFPELDDVLERFASPPIRNAATLGGNVANGSPIGDSMPALIALGARVVLGSHRGSREMPLEDLYTGYRQTAMEADELVVAIRVPRPAPGGMRRVYKISKRFDQDISAVLGAFALEFDDERVSVARIAFGGMAAVPARAVETERALLGCRWRDGVPAAAYAALESDFTPMSDMRASAAYRMTIARNLLSRFSIETTRPEVVTDVRQVARSLVS